MKKLIHILVVLLLMQGTLKAQVFDDPIPVDVEPIPVEKFLPQIKPNGLITPRPATQTLNPRPSTYYVGLKLNYIRVWEPVIPIKDETQVISSVNTVREVKQSTQYFDGLGRPIQTVIKQGSPLKKDVVSPVIYDAYGREVYKYLPYVSVSDDGKFKADPFAEQESFLQAFYNPQNSSNGEKFFYGKTEYEASFMGRPVKTMPAGNSWVGSGRGVSLSYEINVASEVRLWTIGQAIGSLPQSTGYYAAGSLTRTVTADEHGNRVVEYKDKEGRVLLKKVETGGGMNIALHEGWLCTYYVYDDFGSLRFVLPPKQVEELAKPTTNWVLTQAQANELCFRYEYDARKRMIIKKVPGAAEVHMVYDYRDRLVMTQDGNLRNTNQWIITQYDALNRPVRTYLVMDPDVRGDHQLWAEEEGVTTYPTYLLKSSDLLTQTFYDDYSWASGISGISSNLNNSFMTSGEYISTYNSAPYYAQEVKKSVATMGMVTGTKTRILGTSQYLYTVSLYDENGRVIQVQSTNASGGTDIATTQYDFSGKVLRTQLQHSNPQAATGTVRLTSYNSYDDGGRLTLIEKKINGLSKKPVSVMRYDELGQLKTKELGTDPDNNTPLETLDYTYTIRGWLSGINRGYANGSYSSEAAVQGSRWFGMNLSYDYGFNKDIFQHGLYNGNISGVIWKSRGSAETRSYGFDYDPMNRLLYADFNQFSNGNWNKEAGIDYTVKMGDGLSSANAYDANGNILRMQQWGLKGLGSVQIDDLSYQYSDIQSGAFTNKLSKVTDAVTADHKLGDFKDGQNTGNDYTYDINGNMVTDGNKSISAIAYNHLNLPQEITVTGKGTISYMYDAAGIKLRKTTVDNTVSPAKTTVTDYMGSFVYEHIGSEAPKLQFFAHEEGRVRYRTLTDEELGQGNDPFVYDYFIKDHLGNVRMMLTEEQKTDVYPMASLENAESVEFEKQYYRIDDNYVEEAPVSYIEAEIPNNNGFSSRNPYIEETAGSKKLYRINPAAGNKIGLTSMIKVMSGDRVDIHARSYYEQTGDAGDTDPLTVTDILETLLLSPGSGSGSSVLHGVNATTLSTHNGGASGLIGSLIQILSNTADQNNPRPRAFVNWILFDEQMRAVNYGFSQVGYDKEIKSHYEDGVMQGVQVSKNGYLYVYCSNESPVNVYFDNVQIVHTRGRLLEETHYYPFGLTMTGISSRAVGSMEANKRFQGQDFAHNEFRDGSGLEMYEFKYRMHDPQTGRFWQIDPLADKYVYNSTYAFSENHVTAHVELEGLEKVPVNQPKDNPLDPQKYLPPGVSPAPSSSPPPKPASQESSEKKQEKSLQNEPKDKPAFGRTYTDKTTTDVLPILNTQLGDKVELKTTASVTAGQSGSIMNIDISKLDGKTDALTVTLGGTVSISVGMDGLGVGISIKNTEVSAAYGPGVGLGELNLSATNTTNNFGNSGQLSIRPGGGSVLTAAVVASILLIPEVSIPILTRAITMAK